MMANDLRKTFPKRKQKQPKVAVRNVSFHVTNGEVFGLLGPNGAGKSTVINMVIAEHAPSAGKVGFMSCNLLESNTFCWTQSYFSLPRSQFSCQYVTNS